MAKRFIGNVKGVGVSGIQREFYMSNSSSVLEGGSWSTEIPTLGNNKYLWYRDKFTLTDNTVITTAPLCDGVWEEIYDIYDISGNMKDFVDRLGIEESKVQPINLGGTGAKNRVDASKNINFIGLNPISSINEDTVANWNTLGTGVAYVNEVGLLVDQPTQYGWLENYTYGDSVYQVWRRHGNEATTCVRTGDVNGWFSTSWVEMLSDNKIGKLLWSGSWGSGNITVPEINDYTVVAAKLSGEAVILIGVKPFSTLRLYAVYFNGSNYIDYGINISISNSVLTLNSAGYKSGSSAHIGKPVSEIWGIV